MKDWRIQKANERTNEQTREANAGQSKSEGISPKVRTWCGKGSLSSTNNSERRARVTRLPNGSTGHGLIRAQSYLEINRLLIRTRRKKELNNRNQINSFFPTLLGHSNNSIIDFSRKMSLHGVSPVLVVHSPSSLCNIR